MNILLQNLLIIHVISGILGVIALYAVLISLIKSALNLEWLRQASLWGVVLLILSWLTGGYYYATYYGAKVKPVIVKGSYPWAHTVFMEAKEHIFLFLPFLSLAIFLALWLLGERLEINANLKRALIFLTGLATSLGVIVTLFGVIISGAVR